MTEVLDFSGISVRRGTATLLKDINWNVGAGERWVILGPNGAGKTTLLNIAAARLHPSSGTAHILGEQLGRVDVFELRPRLGFISALLSRSIPPNESALDVVLTAAYGVAGRWREEYEEEDVERAKLLLDVFGMSSMVERTFGTLSEGERKRTQIARALMTDPEVLLLDEPAAGLDLGGREELVGALSELAADDFSPVQVLVTHHVEEIPKGYTHAMLIKDGEAAFSGEIDEVLTSENLSDVFEVNLNVQRAQDRFYAQARSSE